MGTVTDPAKLCDLFLRRSTLQDDKTTLHAHERDLRERAVREGLTVRKVWKEELSAFKAGVKREEFDSAISAVLAGEVRHLLVWKLDRLSRRGMGQVGQVLDQFDSKGARLLAHMDGLDSSIPQHRGLFAWLAEQTRSESYNTSTRTRRTKAEKKFTGAWPDGQPPYGLRVRKGKTATEHHPKEYATSRRIADGSLADKAAGTIADELNAESLTTRRGGRWRSSTITQMSQGEVLNAALRSAMEDAKLTPRKLATRIGVAPKTVERWLADAELLPHARNRVDACRALKVDEDMIWPKAVQERVKTGHDRELAHAYPYRSACPSTVWGELIAGASTDIFFAGYTNYFVWLEQPAFIETLRRKIASGCRVRFLLGDPDGEVTRQREAIEDVALSVGTRIRISLEHLGRLGPLDGLETRFSSPEDAVNHVSLSVFRFDHDALVTPHLARLVGHDSPLLHLRRQGDSGMFDRFAEHAEELWDRGVPQTP